MYSSTNFCCALPCIYILASTRASTPVNTHFVNNFTRESHRIIGLSSSKLLLKLQNCSRNNNCPHNGCCRRNRSQSHSLSCSTGTHTHAQLHTSRKPTHNICLSHHAATDLTGANQCTNFKRVISATKATRLVRSTCSASYVI